jgi:hypothetical protein
LVRKHAMKRPFGATAIMATGAASDSCSCWSSHLGASLGL